MDGKKMTALLMPNKAMPKARPSATAKDGAEVVADKTTEAVAATTGQAVKNAGQKSKK